MGVFGLGFSRCIPLSIVQYVHCKMCMSRKKCLEVLESGRWPCWNDSVGMDLSTTSVSLQLKLKRALLVLDSCAKSHERYTVR